MRILLFCTALIITGACKGPGLSSKTCARPEGRFVNQTLLMACDSVMYATLPFFAVELRFRDSTTVIADNGFEQFPLTVEYDRGGCSGVLKSATLYGDMPFELNAEGAVILQDTAWTKASAPSIFKRSTLAGQENWSFRELLNSCIFPLTYIRQENGNTVPGRIELLANGQMNGMRPFVGYTLCFAGDCLEDADPFLPTITFLTATGELETYAMEIVEDGLRLRFFPLAPPEPDIKGSRKVGRLAFEWVAE